MKMQEVITKLREEAPLLEKCTKSVDATFHKAWGLFDDFRRAESEEGQRLLADAVCAALNEFAGEYRTLRCSIETVCMVNAEYKEKLGPRTKKSRDAGGQMMLPGFGDGSDLQCTTSGTSATAGRASSFMQSGRLG